MTSSESTTVSQVRLNDLLYGKVSKVEKYRRSPWVNTDYDGVRVVIDLKLPEDMELYRMFKRLAT